MNDQNQSKDIAIPEVLAPTAVGEQARAAGFGDKEVYSVQLATDEAASNVP